MSLKSTFTENTKYSDNGRMMDGSEKKVDSSWKAKVEQEKAKAAPKDKIEKAPAEKAEKAEEAEALTFSGFVAGLYYEALIAFGKIPHPATGETNKNVEQARMIIDTLMMLREKTVNNLDEEEINRLNEILYQLQSEYVNATGGGV